MSPWCFSISVFRRQLQPISLSSILRLHRLGGVQPSANMIILIIIKQLLNSLLRLVYSYSSIHPPLYIVHLLLHLHHSYGSTYSLCLSYRRSLRDLFTQSSSSQLCISLIFTRTFGPLLLLRLMHSLYCILCLRSFPLVLQRAAQQLVQFLVFFRDVSTYPGGTSVKSPQRALLVFCLSLSWLPPQVILDSVPLCTGSVLSSPSQDAHVILDFVNSPLDYFGSPFCLLL